MADVKSEFAIARAAGRQPIQEIDQKLGIPAEHLLPYGHDKAKVSVAFIKSLRANKSETFACLKFTLGVAGERSDGYARTPAHALGSDPKRVE